MSNEITFEEIAEQWGKGTECQWTNKKFTRSAL